MKRKFSKAISIALWMFCGWYAWMCSTQERQQLTGFDFIMIPIFIASGPVALAAYGVVEIATCEGVTNPFYKPSK